MKLTILLIVLLSHFNLSAQVKIIGTVTNQSQMELEGVFIQNLTTNFTVISNHKGVFEIEVNLNDTLLLNSIGYETKVLIIDKLNYELFIELIQKSKVLNTVNVNGKKAKTVVDNPNETIIDFIFWENYIVYLSKIKNKYFIGLSNQIKILNCFEIGFNKPKQLQLDSKENLFILNKDSAFQVYIDTAFYIIDRLPLLSFNTFIKPVKSITSNKIISERIDNHNKNYSLFFFNGGNKESIVIYNSYDIEAEKIAKSNYYEIISTYNRTTSETANIITNKFWSGDINELGNLNDTISRMITWYKHIRAKSLNVVTLQNNNQIVVFDFFKDSIIVFNLNGIKLSSSSLQQANSKYTNVLLDNITNRFYLLYPYNNHFSIDNINSITGESKSIFKFKEMTQPKNIKINNGWVYYLNNYSGNGYKLYKTRLQD